MQDVLLARVGPRKGDILPDRAVKQEALLQYYAELRAERIQAHRGKIDAVHAHRSLIRRVESGDQADDGRLAGAR